MVKLLFVLTVFFFTVTSMFFVFLTRFNEESKRAALLSRVAGVSVSRNAEDLPIATPTGEASMPTVTPEPTDEPTPTDIPKKILEIKLGFMEINGKKTDVKVVKEVEEEKSNVLQDGKIPFQDFELHLIFAENVKPGSADDKFIFQNKEYEIKILNKKGEMLNLFLYKINGSSIIINPETGVWEGSTEYEVGVYSDGNKTSGVKFVVE